jgi:hypothetical protein
MWLRKQKSSLCDEAGQILLIVVLVIIVVSTIGLSLASRSITSLRMSTEESESQKALSAAEAGIERILQNSTPVAVNGNTPGNSAYTASAVAISGTTFLMNGGSLISKDEGADLWLSNYSPDQSAIYTSVWSGNLNIYWGESATACSNSALEILAISGYISNPDTIKLTKYVYDPCSTRREKNHFSEPAAGDVVGGKEFHSKAVINGISYGLIVRIVPIYGDAVIGITASNPLPLQGYLVNSTGTSGNASHILNVFNGFPQTYLPYVSYGLFVAN